VHAGGALAQQTVMLRHSRRFGGPIGQLALAVNAGDSAFTLVTPRAPAFGEALAQRTRRASGLLSLLGR
jgi:exodeoxyribonuclease V alpha subunit